MELLDRFYKKFNRALLDKLATERERDRLLRENEDLQSILKQYLDGISVNEDVMNRENPLLVVNHRLRLNHQAPVKRKLNPASIDGRHASVKHGANFDGAHVGMSGFIYACRFSFNTQEWSGFPSLSRKTTVR